MTGDDKSKRKLRRLIGIVFSLASLVVLTYIAIALISGRGLKLSRLTGAFSSREPAELAEEYFFDVGRDRVFANLEGRPAAAGTLGVQVLDAAGEETLKDPFRMATPALYARDGLAIAFDIGGTAVRVFNNEEILASVEAAGPIISASVNRNGWFCVCAQEGGGYKGTATVYNGSGSKEYRVSLASGYVLSAELSPDNRNLAVLNLTVGGSRVTFYDLSSDSTDNVYELPGRLIVDIRYLNSNELLVITDGAMTVIDRHGSVRELFSFSGGRLRGYAIEGEYIALHLLDYGVGYHGRLATLAQNGELLGEIVTNRDIVSMSVGAGFVAVLRGDGLVFYDITLGEIPPAEDRAPTVGATQVVALSVGDGAAIVAGDHSATVIRLTGGSGP